MGRNPRIIGVPVLSPRLSSYWLDLVTAVPASVARPLVDGLAYDVIANDAEIRRLIPLKLMTFREAAEEALRMEREACVPARWTDGAMLFRNYRSDYAFYAKRLQVSCESALEPANVWSEIVTIGADKGWYYQDWLWSLRGLVDRLAGGVGMRRGRRSPRDLRVGDTLDFWRVVGLDRERQLTLAAEMRLPGSAVLKITLTPRSQGGTRLGIVVYFHPAGYKGLAYWYVLAPVDRRLFHGLCPAILERTSRHTYSSTDRSKSSPPA